MSRSWGWRLAVWLESVSQRLEAYDARLRAEMLEEARAARIRGPWLPGR